MGAAASRRATAPTGAVLVAPGAVEPTLDVTGLDDSITGNRCYLATVGDGIAIVVDPPRDIDSIREWATDAGLSIVAAFETHLHGDHVSGAHELHEEGVVVVCPARAELAYPHRGVRDGTVVLVGDVEVHACATGGHTDDQVAYVVVRDGIPAGVFGGGLLTARVVDLELEADDGSESESEEVAPIDIRPTARGRSRLDGLDVDTPLYLTHPGPAVSGDDWPATVGEMSVRATRPLAAQPHGANRPRSADVAAVVEINRHGPRLLRDVATPAPLDADEVAYRIGRGAWLLDARRPEAWALAHAPLSVSAPAGAWFAWLLPRVAPPGAAIVLLADDDVLDDCIAAAQACGHDGLAGWVDGGWPAWQAGGFATRTTTLSAPAAVASLRAAGMTTVDVRTGTERDALRLPATEHLPLPDLAAGLTPDHDDIVLVCSDGVRAAAAASLLEPRGVQLHILAGGLTAWRAAGFAVLEA